LLCCSFAVSVLCPARSAKQPRETEAPVGKRKKMGADREDFYFFFAFNCDGTLHYYL
jgi:hypothetical protein